MLGSSIVPSIIAFVFRFKVPESAVWLMRREKVERARAIVTKHLGPGVALPVTNDADVPEAAPSITRERYSFRRNVLVGCVLQASLVVPFYALATFMPLVMEKLGVDDGYVGTLFFNTLNFIGASLGILIIDRLSRRRLITNGFAMMSVLLLVMILWRGAPSPIIVLLFATFAFVIAATGNLQFVYPPELFPTELRARGIGAVVATSRIGSASSTFFLPSILEYYGVYVTLGICLSITIFAGVFCYAYAPETLRKRLA